MTKIWDICFHTYQGKYNSYCTYVSYLDKGSFIWITRKVLREHPELVKYGNYANRITVYKINDDTGKYTASSLTADRLSDEELQKRSIYTRIRGMTFYRENGQDITNCECDYDYIFKDNGRLYYMHDIVYPLYDITGDIAVVENDSYKPQKTGPFYDSLKYTFGDKTVYMKKDMAVCCIDTETKKEIWQRRIYHYLDTEIEEKEGRLYFGTAGNGGAFYCLSLETGEVVFELPFGDCSYYFWHKGNILVADRRKKFSDPLWMLVDPKTGTIIKYTDMTGHFQARKDNRYFLVQKRYDRSNKQYELWLAAYDLD